MSGRPILVYGPPWSGTVEYARQGGWGVVVDSKSGDALLRALNYAKTPAGSKETVARGYDVAAANHDIRLLRRRVFDRITAASNHRAQTDRLHPFTIFRRGSS